jgi:hypothetical protein
MCLFWVYSGFWFCVVFPILVFVLNLLLVNILRVISVSGCRLFKPNHLNFGILYDCVIYYYAIFFFLGIPKS